MNIVDIVLSIFLLLGFVRGFFKGFFVELAGLIGLILGIYGAIHFSDRMLDFLEIFITWKEEYLSILAFALTFSLIVIVISIIGKALTKMAGILALGLVNRMLGAIFGMLKTAFLASVFFMFLNQAGAFMIQEETKESAVLYPPVEKLAPALLPSLIEKLKDNDLLTEEEDL